MKSAFPTVKKTFLNLVIFSVAMGFLEAIVVVYLRHQFYPEGFNFPFKMLPTNLILIEWIREIATIVMLVSVGILAGKDRMQKFFYFLFAFAVWDIVYYLALKLFLDWPESLLTWDILFLIPIPWIGPVLAPVICSLTMIVFATTTISYQEKGALLQLKAIDWILILSGVALILYSFMQDFFNLIAQNGFLSDFWTLASNEHFWKIIAGFIPTYYNWWLFVPGELLIITANFMVLKRMRINK
jgi:hypothetical protein